MQIETVGNLAEQLADWFGIYGVCRNAIEGNDTPVCADLCTFDKAKPFCCRQGFVGAMEDRIREAVENEKKLYNAGIFD